ncbi:hypothetical protein DNTS_003329 [Danionella cerebrum]|uniref:Claudin n=1 Tax=Danionella cerebrum TaxID=2873325 RepID=A0A553QNV2_9TELE|nr:hypothetical protein DNTS_003329 [Danionella translucida]TRY91664.1 hypothetical protein DNTS_003329 [Danionella translucida]
MHRRTVLMYTEIGCFLLCTIGCILICSTVFTEYWAFSAVDSTVLTSNHYFSNLWKDCLSDSTGVSDCKEFPSMLALQAYIHVCRSFLIISITLSSLGLVLVLVGMKCTKVGGSERDNAKITFAGGITFFSSGLCGMFAYSWYGHRVVSEFMDPNYRGKRFELGSALFIGWAGSALLLIGGLVYSQAAYTDACQTRSKKDENLFLAGDQQMTSPLPSLVSDKGTQKQPGESAKASYGRDAYV